MSRGLTAAIGWAGPLFGDVAKKRWAMTSEPDSIQDRNIAAVFQALDTNGDGTLAEADFDLRGRGLCGRFGIDADGDHGQQIMATYQAWWEQLRGDLDTDNDGKITMAEFVSAYKAGQGDPQQYFQERLGQLVSVAAAMIDTDNDGFISQDEYLTLFAITVPDRQVALAGFQQLDTDGDGRISTAELEAGIRAMMLSNDPATPGTALLGQAP